MLIVLSKYICGFIILIYDYVKLLYNWPAHIFCIW